MTFPSGSSRPRVGKGVATGWAASSGVKAEVAVWQTVIAALTPEQGGQLEGIAVATLGRLDPEGKVTPRGTAHGV